MKKKEISRLKENNKKIKINYEKSFSCKYINIIIRIYIILRVIFCEFYFISGSQLFIRKINLGNEITLTIKGNSVQKILGDDYKSALPDQIYINGVYNTKKSKTVTITGSKNIQSNVTLKWNSLLTSCSCMFRELGNIIRIDFSKFNTSLVTSMFLMFFNCNSLISLDLSNFNTSLVIDMCSMFYGCKSLTSLNIDSFDTSQVSNMYTMFYQCHSLTSLKVNHFNTSKVLNMNYMFSECKLLTSLDISNFDTSAVVDMSCMFCFSESLISLDLKNFKTENVLDMSKMFSGCKSLIFINLESFVAENPELKTSDFFKNMNDFILCIDEDKAEMIIKNNEIKNNNCSNDCFKESRKILMTENKCINNCSSTSEYQYEFDNVCYTGCPENTHSSSYDKYVCVIDLNCEKLNKYYDYEQKSCIDEIPDGFFVNDTKLNTTDKCHQDCKTCDKKYNENNSNCNSCLDDKFLYLGNCTYNCPYGSYVDLSGNKICVCSLECKECSIESLESDLCISCNTDFYPKIDDSKNKNSFIKCYKEPEGYYLDNDIYKPCYSSCKNCSGFGTESYNNCTECKSGYILENIENCYEICPFYYYFDSSNKYQCTDQYNCPNEYNKLIKERNKCINSCKNDNIYQYEFNNTCYKECPEGTISINKDNNYFCEIEILNKTNIYYSDISYIPHTSTLYYKSTIPDITNLPKTSIFPAISDSFDISNKTQKNISIKECNATEFFNGTCKSNDIDKMIKNIKEQLNSTLETLSSDDVQLDLIMKEKDVIYQVTTTDNNKEYNDISKLKLGECEHILKEHYGIDPNKSLIIFKIDYYMEGLSIPLIGYEVFHPDTKVQLELSHCKSSLIGFDIPVSINEKELFKHDPTSEYYTNECFPYTSENGTDILLNDRKEEFIEHNLSLCEDKCTYNGYNENSKKVSCDCEVKSKEFLISTIINNENLLSNNFTLDNTTSNFITMKCIYTLFTKEGLKKNIANYVICVIFILFIILAILFCKVGLYLFENDIKQIVKMSTKNNKINIYSPGNKIIKKKKKKGKSIDIANPRKKRKSKTNLSVNKGVPTNKDSENLSKSQSKLNLKMHSFLNKSPINKDIKIYNEKIKNNLNADFYDCELNSFSFKESIKHDKRTNCQYYISLIKIKHPIIFSFVPVKDYNLMIVKVSLFLLSFIIYFAINTICFNNSIIHEIYINKGKYKINQHITRIIISFFISYIICIIIKYFSLSERDILKIKHLYKKEKVKDMIKKIKKCLIIRYSCFYTMSFILIIFFWYYSSSFCAVYRNSQLFLIINTIISFILSFIYPFIINLIPTVFRNIGIKKKSRCLFSINKIIQLL